MRVHVKRVRVTVICGRGESGGTWKGEGVSDTWKG